MLRFHIDNGVTADDGLSRVPGLAIIVDTQKCSARMARCTVRYVETIVGDPDECSPIVILVVRPDAFWDNQLVENCTKSYKKDEVCNV